LTFSAFLLLRQRSERVVVRKIVVDRTGQQGNLHPEKQEAHQGLASNLELQYIPTPFCSFQSDGQVESWNQAMEGLTGIAANDAIGKKFWDVIGWMPTGEVGTGVLAQIFRGNRVDNVDWVFLHPTGERLDLRATLVPIVREMGNIQGVVASIQDRTLSLRQAKLLQDLDVVKNSLMSAVPETLIRLDSYGRAVEVRDNAKFLGSKAKEISGTTRWQRLLPAQIVQQILEGSREVRLHQKRKTFHLEDGTSQSETVFSLSPCGQTDVLLLIQTISHQAPIAECATVQLILQDMTEPFVSIDGRGQIVYLNAATADLLQKGSHKIVETALVDWLAPSSRLALLKGLGDLVQNPTVPALFDVSFRLASGPEIPARIKATNRLSDPQIGAILMQITLVPQEETLHGRSA
jgi:PAS domain S-box-containing protein